MVTIGAQWQPLGQTCDILLTKGIFLGMATTRAIAPPVPPSYFQRVIRSSHDRFWNCQADSFVHNLPLVIMYSGYSLWPTNHSFERARSDIFAVELVVGGNADLQQDTRHMVVSPGEAFLLHKGHRHRFSTGPAGRLNKRMVVIEGIMLEIVLRSLGLESIDVVRLERPGRLAGLIKQVNRLSGSRGENYMWQLSLLAYEILLELAKNVLYLEVPTSVSLALNYMNRNVEKNLTLPEIAARSGVSMYHFSRLFQKSMKTPPMTFFHRQKMTFARNLLANSTLLVKEIAALLGYDDPFYFSAQFTRYEGVSPRAYRSRHRQTWWAPGEQ